MSMIPKFASSETEFFFPDLAENWPRLCCFQCCKDLFLCTRKLKWLLIIFFIYLSEQTEIASDIFIYNLNKFVLTEMRIVFHLSRKYRFHISTYETTCSKIAHGVSVGTGRMQSGGLRIADLYML